jgi:hypothetical protein
MMEACASWFADANSQQKKGGKHSRTIITSAARFSYRRSPPIHRPPGLAPGEQPGALYYGLAGAGHAVGNERNAKEQFVLVSDLWIFLLLAVFVATRVV